MNNFWHDLPRPIYALAPMAGITDSPFRRICKRFGAAVLYGEMASVAALTHRPNKTLTLLKAMLDETPYVVQLFGSEPEQFITAVKVLMSDVGFQMSDNSAPRDEENPTSDIRHLISGLDINFGCPVPKVLKQGAGSALFVDLKKSHAVIKAVLDNTDLPVSVKIRAGAKEVDALKWLEAMNDLNISAVMIHGRTLAQGFAGPIDTQIIKNARQVFGGIILANGGVNTLAEAKNILEQTGADGLGLARGVLGNPWLFAELNGGAGKPKDLQKIIDLALEHGQMFEHFKTPQSLDGYISETAARRFDLALEHGQMFVAPCHSLSDFKSEDCGSKKNFVEFRKHLGWYLAGLPAGRELKAKLMRANNLEEVRNIFSLIKIKTS